MRRADSPSAKEALADSIRRVEGMAIVHDLLARSGADAVDVRALARRLLDSAIAFAELPGQAISGRVDGELTLSGDRATHVALVLNELVANALKHAFRGRDRGHLAVHLVSAGDCFSCVVRDDGVGLGPDAHSGLGLSIARSIAEGELGGTLVFESDGGTRVTLRAPSGG
jgi:two-component sensor histidine kinase